jgi:hypothetical protein
MDFCPKTFTRLEEVVTQDKLYFKSHKTGAAYTAGPVNTMLVSEEIGQIHSGSRYQNTLKETAFEPTNPRTRPSKGCDKCGRKVISFQRLSEAKKVYYSCLCGNSWHN